MMLTKAKCPACGGALELNPGLERGICVYCGSEFLVQEAIQKFKAEVDGLPTLKNMLIRAEQMLSDGDLQGAEALYEKILEGAPTCHEAWWGKFKMDCKREWPRKWQKPVESCDKNFSLNYDFSESIKHVIERCRDKIKNLEGSREALRALEYAPDDVKVFYRGEIERIKRTWEAALRQLEAERDRVEMDESIKKSDRRRARNFITALLISGGLVWGFLSFVSRGPGPSIPIGGWITMFVMYTGMLCPFVLGFIAFISGGD